jgi:hypothetical protein
VISNDICGPQGSDKRNALYIVTEEEVTLFKYVSFPWLPLEAALSILGVSFFVTDNFLMRE